METNKEYFSKRDNFYCLVITDVVSRRDDKISDIFGIPYKTFYLGDGLTSDISLARFWKDIYTIGQYVANRAVVINDIISLKNDVIFEIKVLNREEFLDCIPDEYEVNNYFSIRNLKLKAKETKYKRKWDIFRKKYKASVDYVKVINPHYWIPCKICGLIPLISTDNDIESTACGCDYSIKVEKPKNQGHEYSLCTSWNYKQRK